MKAILIATTAIAALGAIAPQAAHAQSKRQKRENDRDLMATVGVGLGAAALDKLRKGDSATALLLGAGAALAAKKYDDQNKKLKEYDRYDDRRWDDRRFDAYDRDDRYSRNGRDDRFSRNDRDDHFRFERDDRWSRDRDDDDCRRDNRRRPAPSKSRYSRDRDNCDRLDLTGPGGGRR